MRLKFTIRRAGFPKMVQGLTARDKEPQFGSAKGEARLFVLKRGYPDF
ncbi:MAG: hypothetical protein KGK16_14770 [Bradyrhizobium sp.]|nr:hypothetical protein [Bradyrhizobium sp.]